MTTRPGWKPLALTCLLTMTMSLGDGTFADSKVLPTGRRRERIAQRQSPSEEAPRRFPGEHQARRMPTEPVLAEGVRPGSAVEPQIPSSEPEADSAQQVDPLLQLAERAISKTSQRYLDADQNWPWQIMHGVLALRRDFELTRGDGKVNCIDFISNAPTFRKEHWFEATKHGGRAHPYSGTPYEFEGHANQFLALLSMSNLPPSHEFTVANGRVITMADMIRHAKMTVSKHEEITWTLWFLTHYLDIDDQWTNEIGEPWSMEELVRIQTKGAVTGAPCGGTHGLFALAYARNAFLHKHGRLQGIYYQADQKLKQHIELARSLQNYDGSFSSEFFKGPGHSRDFNERLKASGHMLEWLMMALPQRRINEPWVRRAVASISTDLIHHAAQPAKCGPLYHALNSLIMYRDRIKPKTSPTDEPVEPELASKPQAPDEPETTRDSQQASPLQIAPAPKVARNDDAGEIQTPAESEPTALPLPPEPEENPRNELAQKAGARLADIASQMTTEAEDAPETGPALAVPEKESRRITIEPDERSVR